MNNSISIVETALRISLLLLTVKKEMSLERITCYDFMTSYLNDYNCKQENLEAISPFEKEEFIIKSEIVTNSLKFLLSYNLISVSYNETGIYYKSSTFEQKISSEAYINFADEITKTLKAWNYIDEHDCIDFHEKEMDICINGEPRKNTGKGHRALTYTAFIISLLKFAKKHIGFVMIDSPLLNLREVDKNNPTVSPEIKNAFWKDLAETKNDSQIIIIENNEPPINIQQKINYIKFTNDETIGRRGFY